MEGENGFSLLDTHFAQFLTARSRFSGEEKEQFFELVAKLSSSMVAGHSCLPVTTDESALLLEAHLVSASGQTPLIVHNRHLYLHRYFHYESRLARQIKVMAGISYTKKKESRRLLEQYFGRDEVKINWQKRAAEVALEKGLTIISGGPGTGKTTTVVKIIAILLEAGDSSLRIGLAAPTGKAAMRLQLSIGGSCETMELSKEIESAIPREAKTLHRLLGTRRNSPQFRHNSNNPMSWDVVIVDEASMIDLALMSKLVDALKPGARLVLLGDKDQLASVESGSVFGDCIKSLPENTVTLLETYRFDGGIKGLAESINEGDSGRVWSILCDKKNVNVTLENTNFSDHTGERYEGYMENVTRVEDIGIEAVFSAFVNFQVLCSVHRGERGVAGINRKIEFYLAGKGFSPILVTEDDYADLTGQAPDGTAEKIRQWLINNYQAMGLKYVLLIGNPDPDDPSSSSDSVGDVPMKMCWPRSIESSYKESPTDYFYADLTGNWDLDGDGYFGEFGTAYGDPDCDRGDGGVDFLNEVYVGRIPVYTGGGAQLDSVLSKIIAYGNAVAIEIPHGGRGRSPVPVAVAAGQPVFYQFESGPESRYRWRRQPG